MSDDIEDPTENQKRLFDIAEKVTVEFAELLTNAGVPAASALQVTMNLAGIVASQDESAEWRMHVVTCLRAAADDIQRQSGLTVN